MKYIIIKNAGYIIGVGCGNSGEEITEGEYETILSIIRDKPHATETSDYRLREDFTWEEYEIPPMPEPEPDAQEILNILMGVEE